MSGAAPGGRASRSPVRIRRPASEGGCQHALDRARTAARREAGLEDRVAFTVADASRLDGGPYDLVCLFECLHDMPGPSTPFSRPRAPRGGAAVLVAT